MHFVMGQIYLISSSETERGSGRRTWEMQDCPGGDRLCWQHSTAEINSEEHCASPAPLHGTINLSWRAEDGTRGGGCGDWKSKEAVTYICWDIGTIVARLPVVFARCAQYLNRQWNIFHMSSCLGCHGQWCSGKIGRWLIQCCLVVVTKLHCKCCLWGSRRDFISSL